MHLAGFRPLKVQPAAINDEQVAEAIRIARQADVSIAVVGDCQDLAGETKSTATLDLIGGQIELLRSVIAIGKPVIVVIIASKPQVLPQFVLDGAAAIIWAANPGMRGGQAISELIAGTIEPVGRLPISWPRHVGQQPVYYNTIRGQHGTTYADMPQDPAFAFGEGLTYSNVEYSDLAVTTPHVSATETVHAHVTIANTGNRPAHEIVQAYVSDLVTSVTWADKELKAYEAIDLRPGEIRVVELAIAARDCTIVNTACERVVEPGEFELRVGPNSREDSLLKATFTIVS